MIFLFKPKTIVLDCFTHNSSAFEFAKPDYALKFIPDWWKNVPSSMVLEGNFFKSPTIKKCAGFIENYKHGLMLPIWSDLNIELSPIGQVDYRWQFSDLESTIHQHTLKQIDNYLTAESSLHLKIISPWVFKCSEEIKWSWNKPTWNTLKTDPYTVFPGLIEFKNQHNTHINILLRKDKNIKVIHIPFRTPLAHIIPLTERKLKLKHHLISKDEYDQIYRRSRAITFINKNNTIKKVLKEINK